MERVFEEILERLTRMEHRMDKIKTSMNDKVLLSRFLSLQHEYENHSNLLSNRIEMVEESVAAIPQLMAKSKENTCHISQLLEREEFHIKYSECEQLIHELDMDVKTCLQKLEGNKASVAQVNSLSESQTNICGQIEAIESLLQCKVDKSKIPIIQSCEKRVQNMEAFQENTISELQSINGKLQHLTHTMAHKVDASLFHDFKDGCEKELDGKVSHEEIENDLMRLIRGMEENLKGLSLETERLNSDYKSEVGNILNSLQVFEDQLSIDDKKLKEMKHHIDLNCVSNDKLDLKSDRTLTEQLFGELKEFTKQHNTKIQRNISSMDGELNQLKKSYNQLNKQMSLVLRFVDWYSTLQLER